MNFNGRAHDHEFAHQEPRTCIALMAIFTARSLARTRLV
jgi:hypothetical protein